MLGVTYMAKDFFGRLEETIQTTGKAAAQIKLSVLFLLTQQISILIGWSPIPNICHSNCIYHKFLLNGKKLIKINLYKLLSLFCCVC